MQFIRISSACATAAGVTSSVTRMPVTAESGSPPAALHYPTPCTPPKGASMSMALCTFPACVFHVFFSFYGRCRVPGWSRRLNRPSGGFPRASPAYGALRRACSPWPVPLHLLFLYAAAAARLTRLTHPGFDSPPPALPPRLPYGSSVKPRLPDTMAESRRLSLGRYRI